MLTGLTIVFDCIHSAYMSESSVTNDRLRGQLLNLGERFIGFDKVVESDARRARRLEVERNEYIVRRTQELEKDVYGEIRSRADSNRQFQTDIEAFSNTIFEKMQNRIAKRLEIILGELDMLETRCVTLERGQQQFRGDVPSKLQVDTAALIKVMNELKTKLEGDVKVWRAREDAMSRKIELTVKNIMVDVDKFESQETDMLNRIMGDLARLGDKKSNKNDLLNEVSVIRQSLQLEEENRKYADSQILNAINSYTGVLQRGLENIAKAR